MILTGNSQLHRRIRRPGGSDASWQARHESILSMNQEGRLATPKRSAPFPSLHDTEHTEYTESRRRSPGPRCTTVRRAMLLGRPIPPPPLLVLALEPGIPLEAPVIATPPHPRCLARFGMARWLPC